MCMDQRGYMTSGAICFKGTGKQGHIVAEALLRTQIYLRFVDRDGVEVLKHAKN